MKGDTELSNEKQLNLKRVSSSDSGSYKCIAENGHDTPLVKVISVTVFEAPEITSLSKQEVFTDGTKFFSACYIKKGSKPIFFQWLKNGHVLNEDDEIKIESSEDVSLFTIKHVKLNDAGNYTCVAKNAIGADSSTVVLTVKVPLRWTKEPQDTAVKLEERLQIECDAFGVPKPKIKWFSKEGEIIGDKLRFDKISVSDKGSFVCVAENGFDQPLKKAINI
ncbi:cell adhesion molecule-like protein, partial [Dinothrombium tinctorium]